MSARCRGCGGALTPIDQAHDQLCAAYWPGGCWMAARTWAREHDLRLVARASIIPPVTVDAWLEAGAPGARQP